MQAVAEGLVDPYRQKRDSVVALTEPEGLRRGPSCSRVVICHPWVMHGGSVLLVWVLPRVGQSG